MNCGLIVGLVALAGFSAHAAQLGKGAAGKQRENALLQTYSHQLNDNAAGGKNTPVTRVVNLLKEMGKTLNKEMEEDEGLYKELSCWCNDNVYSKKLSEEENQQQIVDLKATIEALTAKSSELKTKIKELEDKAAADKAALAEATALREKELKEFHSMELDDIAAIENLKAAIVVLSKHQDAAFPQMPLSFLQQADPWSPEHESHMSFAFDEFLRKQNFQLGKNGLEKESKSNFLQGSSADTAAASGRSQGGWSANDLSTLSRAVKTANAFMQEHHGSSYYPSYNAQSGEIYGVLEQLKEEMSSDLKEAQEKEATRAARFAELRSAKTAEIEESEKMAEAKEDEKAETDNALAEAKEDLGQTGVALGEDETSLANLEKTCKEASVNFEKRKEARLAEIQAVGETIEILTGEEARDAMDTAFSFMQTSKSEKSLRVLRKKAAAVLRKFNIPQLSMLATSVELDAFTKVKEMIDKMIVMLKAQQADEVKKNDWCIQSLQENEMNTAKTKDLKADLEAKSNQLMARIKTLTEEIEKAKSDISNLQVDLQRASENRKKENLDFQKVVADQMVTAEILAKALDKLATFYDDASFSQLRAKGSRKQTPPVPQMEYSKSKGATGVMSMIEKLIYDTKDITAESKKSESEAQAAYEALVADTNASIEALTKEITMKTKARSKAKKDLSLTKSDLSDAIRELEELAKTNADLHLDCDYVMKNFMVRQKARQDEVEALQQAKQILSGADLK
jgi:cell division protein FtsB|mmetsp:Transcript_104480/g.164882  ORF Transcript_104480/g.164882 Transcript_104480/m.164882 type:complete len:741 (+) Transcript_104480:67-2289(+)